MTMSIDDNGPRRQPNATEIEAGYWLVNWRHNYEHLAKTLGAWAVKHVELARDNQVLTEERGFGMEWSRPLGLMNEAQGATHLVGEAHDGLREVLRKRGVHGITNADFEAFEAAFDFSSLPDVEIGHDDTGYYIKCRVGGGCR